MTSRRILVERAGPCNICSAADSPLLQTRDGQVRVCDVCWDRWWAWSHEPCGESACEPCREVER